MRKNSLNKILAIIGVLLIIFAILLILYNVWEDYQAGKKSKYVLDKLTDKIVVQEESDNLLNDETKMSTTIIDDKRYIGILNLIPFGIELPVLADYSYDNMKIAPVRYKGSVYLNNLIIAGHGYTRHFQKLKNLKKGDQVTFTDTIGKIFEFEVIKIELLDQNDVAKMEEGNWDLTLFTCNFDSTKRVTVRLRNIK